MGQDLHKKVCTLECGIFNKNGGLQVGDSALQTRFAGKLILEGNSLLRETQFAGKLLSLVLVLVKHVTCNKKLGERVSTQRTLVIAGISLYLWDEISTKK